MYIALMTVLYRRIFLIRTISDYNFENNLNSLCTSRDVTDLDVLELCTTIRGISRRVATTAAIRQVTAV